MKKLISAAVLSVALLTGSAFAFDDHHDHDRDHDRDHRRHARIVRTYDYGPVVVVRHRHQRHARNYYDRHHRIYWNDHR